MKLGKSSRSNRYGALCLSHDSRQEQAPARLREIVSNFGIRNLLLQVGETRFPEQHMKLRTLTRLNRYGNPAAFEAGVL